MKFVTYSKILEKVKTQDYKQLFKCSNVEIQRNIVLSEIECKKENHKSVTITSLNGNLNQ